MGKAKKFSESIQSQKSFQGVNVLRISHANMYRSYFHQGHSEDMQVA